MGERDLRSLLELPHPRNMKTAKLYVRKDGRKILLTYEVVIPKEAEYSGDYVNTFHYTMPWRIRGPILRLVRAYVEFRNPEFTSKIYGSFVEERADVYIKLEMVYDPLLSEIRESIRKVM